jgi:hypothetical protein
MSVEAETLLHELRALGVQLVADGEVLQVDAPRGVLTPDLRATLAAHKVELLAHLREPVADAQLTPPPDPAEVARVLGLPLDRLDRMVEVRMAWCPTLWFVPDEPAAEQLLTEGIRRGRVWTIAELLDLLAILGLTKAHARTLALAKLEVDGGRKEGAWTPIGTR